MRTISSTDKSKVSTSSSNLESTSSSTSTALYKYKPSHIIFNELCMILQKRAFDTNPTLLKECKNTATRSTRTIQEIPVCKYNRHNPNHLVVYDIAFGLPGSSSHSIVSNTGSEDRIGHTKNNAGGRKANSSSPMKMPTNGNDRPRALYFHIHEEDVHECTYQERMNNKKTCKKLERLRNAYERKISNSMPLFHSIDATILLTNFLLTQFNSFRDIIVTSMLLLGGATTVWFYYYY